MTSELMNSLTSGFGGIQSHILNTLGVVVPIALSVFAIIFIWIIAVNFFKRIAGVKTKSSKSNNDDYDDDDDDE